jgi:hypothetical protein
MEGAFMETALIEKLSKLIHGFESAVKSGKSYRPKESSESEKFRIA